MVSSDAKTVPAYMRELAEERQAGMKALRKVIRENLPEGFRETMQYGMPSYVVPHKLYPDGYHCNPKEPLPFMHFAAQKRHVAIYHSGLYANEKLMAWFEREFAKQSPRKLNKGKCCVRFSKPEHIPLDLVGQLCRKMTAQQWIRLYERRNKAK